MKVSIAQLRAIGLSDTEILNLVETSQLTEEAEEAERLARQREQWRITKRNQRSRPSCPEDNEDIEDKGSPPSPPPSMVSPITPSLTPPSSSPSPNIPSWPKDFREKFWKAYPRKTGKGAVFRKLEVIRRAGEIEFDRLLAAISLVDASDPKFIPMPMTWLNQGRYLDGIGTVRPPKEPITDEQFQELKAKYDAKIERTA